MTEIDKSEQKESRKLKKKEKKQTEQAPKNQPLMTAFVSRRVRSKELEHGGDQSRDQVPDDGGILKSDEELEKEARMRRKEIKEFPWLQRRKERLVQVEKESVVVTGKASNNTDVKKARPSRICSFDFEEGKVNNIVEHFKAGTENNFHVQRIFTPAKKRGFDFQLLRSSLEYQTKPGNESVVAASPAKRRRLYS